MIYLSKGGGAVPIRTICGSAPAYYMIFFEIPVSWQLVCLFWAALAVVVLFVALCLFCSSSYRILLLVIASFAQISCCSFLFLLDRHPLLWDSEFQLFAWASFWHVSIVGWGREWWLSLYVFLPLPTSPKYRAIKMEKIKNKNKTKQNKNKTKQKKKP